MFRSFFCYKKKMQLAASSSSYHGRPVARRSHPEIELRSTARRRIGAGAGAEPTEEEPGESRGCWEDMDLCVDDMARRARNPTMPVLRCTPGGDLPELWLLMLTMASCR